ncbi:ATP-binding protein [Streptomyces physcomitrii]|uniref:ATP-binding protein n=1 Tax=Streptomyces physcomitrii TaxID=2724184 RepID=UPI0033CF9E30
MEITGGREAATQGEAKEWYRQFTSRSASVALARRQVGKVLERWGYAREDIDRVVLVTSELATNALVHGRVAGRRWEVRLIRVENGCLVEVSDANSRMPQRKTPDEEDEYGRGLLVAAAVADGLGHRERRDLGKTVWARLSQSVPEEPRREPEKREKPGEREKPRKRGESGESEKPGKRGGPGEE